MTKIELKSLLKNNYKEKSEQPGLVVNGKRKPSYLIMYKLYMEHNVPFTCWYDILEYFKKEEEAQKEQGETAPLQAEETVAVQ